MSEGNTEREGRMLRKKWLMLFLRITVSSLIIGYTLKLMSDKYGGIDRAFDHFLSVFSGLIFVWILPAFILHFAGMGLMSLRWKILLSAQGVNAGYSELYSFNLMAAFFNNFLPSTIGGDMIKAVESKRLVGDHTRSIMVIMIERFTGLFALVVIALTAMVIKKFNSDSIAGTDPVLFAVLITGMLLLLVLISHPRISFRLSRLFRRFLPQRLAGILERSISALTVYYNSPRQLFSAVLISIIFQFNMVLYYYFLSRSLGMSPDFVDFMAKAPLLIFLLMTVPSVNGIGVRTVVFRKLIKFPLSVALAVEVADIGLRMVLGVIGGVFFLFHRRERKKEVRE